MTEDKFRFLHIHCVGILSKKETHLGFAHIYIYIMCILKLNELHVHSVTKPSPTVIRRDSHETQATHYVCMKNFFISTKYRNNAK